MELSCIHGNVRGYLGEAEPFIGDFEHPPCHSRSCKQVCLLDRVDQQFSDESLIYSAEAKFEIKLTHLLVHLVLMYLAESLKDSNKF